MLGHVFCDIRLLKKQTCHVELGHHNDILSKFKYPAILGETLPAIVDERVPLYGRKLKLVEEGVPLFQRISHLYFFKKQLIFPWS
jgi:hypothetical protein